LIIFSSFQKQHPAHSSAPATEAMSIALESLVPVQADRDELIQLLTLIATQWHQHDASVANRPLADWPQWCEDQGFRFDVFRSLALQLDTLAYPVVQGGQPDHWLEGLVPSLTTGELLSVLATERPLLLDMFESVASTTINDFQELVETAGGTSLGKRIGLDVGYVLTGVGVGVAGTLVWQKWQRTRAEAAERASKDAARDVETWGDQIHSQEEAYYQKVKLLMENPQRAEQQLQQTKANEGQYKSAAEQRRQEAVNELKVKLNEVQLSLDAALKKQLSVWVSQNPKLDGEAIVKLEAEAGKIGDGAKNQFRMMYQEQLRTLETNVADLSKEDIDYHLKARAASYMASETDTLEKDVFEQAFADATNKFTNFLRTTVSKDAPIKDVIEEL